MSVPSLNSSIIVATSVAPLPLTPSPSGQVKINELLALTPNRWYSDAARSFGGLYYGFVLIAASELGLLNDAVVYVQNQTRVLSATDDFLDLASNDYFGTKFPRFPNEGDAAFRSRILANLLLEGATRGAVINTLNGNGTPIMRCIEPWNPLDTGGWDGPYPGFGGPGGTYPTIFTGGTATTINQSIVLPPGLTIWYSPVTIVPPGSVKPNPLGSQVLTVPSAGGTINFTQSPFEGYGAWGNFNLPYQAFVMVLRPTGSATPISQPPYPPGRYLGYNLGGFTPAAGGYLGLPQANFFAQDTYQDYLINLAKTFGTLIWRCYTNTDIGQRANATAPATINVNNPIVQTFLPII